jgi:3-isopropylmalate dehydratase small subunit
MAQAACSREEPEPKFSPEIKIVASFRSGAFKIMNALKNGLLPIRMDQSVREILSQIPADQTITIDLPKLRVPEKSQNQSFLQRLR